MPETILLVDDEQSFREELRCSLDDYNVIEASNGQEALSLLSKPHEIDLVILDFKMTGLTGTETLNLIKKRSPWIKVIMLTAFSSKDIAVESLRGKADDFLEKPVDIDRLIAAVEKHLESAGQENETGLSGIERKISRVKRYLERNWLKKVSLEDAAAAVSLSPKYLSRVFKEVAKTGFVEYKLKVKTGKAKEFLAETGATISDISDRLGFMNPESFMRIFKKTTGLTPTEYRKKHKKARLKTHQLPGSRR